MNSITKKVGLGLVFSAGMFLGSMAFAYHGGGHGGYRHHGYHHGYHHGNYGHHGYRGRYYYRGWGVAPVGGYYYAGCRKVQYCNKYGRHCYIRRVCR